MVAAKVIVFSVEARLTYPIEAVRTANLDRFVIVVGHAALL